MIIAAIDIGSNAARLLITEVTVTSKAPPVFRKLELFRVPLRLGFDVFETKKISPERIDMFSDTMQAFHHLMKAYKVQHYRAYATSAMRDAENAKEVSSYILSKSGIEIEVISGDLEANLIYENHVAENMDKGNSYLYIDVGGGSTEVSLFSNGKLFFKKSFPIGTIRILKNQVDDNTWNEVKETIRLVTKNHKSVVAIGSGGNINKVFSLSKRKDGKSLPLELLRQYHKELSLQTVQQRIENYGFRADRADVIVPALSIYINFMRSANATEIFVPKIGLADGLIHHIYDEVIAAKK